MFANATQLVVVANNLKTNIMTQEEFDKAPLLNQVLYDCTGMLAENHPDIVECMQEYAKALQLLQANVSNRRELLKAFQDHYQSNKFNDERTFDWNIDNFLKAFNCG
jgi:N-acetyl-anhydromuramyl-L-alanine amidase AmpD